jgi:hypothetical protein
MLLEYASCLFLLASRNVMMRSLSSSFPNSSSAPPSYTTSLRGTGLHDQLHIAYNFLTPLDLKQISRASASILGGTNARGC